MKRRSKTTKVKAKLDGQVVIRLTPAESKRWRAMAKAEGRSLSNWMRQQLNAAAPQSATSNEQRAVLSDPKSWEYSARPFDVVELESTHKLEHDAELAAIKAKAERDAGIGVKEFMSDPGAMTS